MDWQSITALGIVGLTLVVFAIRLIRPRKKRSCGGSCACPKK